MSLEFLGPDCAGATAPADSAALGPRTRWSRQVVADLVSMADIAVIAASAYVALTIQSMIGAPVASTTVALVMLELLTVTASYIALRRAGHYNLLGLGNFTLSLPRLVVPIFVAFSIVIAVASALGVTEKLPKTWFPVWLGAATTLMFAERLIVQMVLRGAAANGNLDKTIAIYGAGRIARKLVDFLGERPTGVRIVGIYDDRQDSARLDLQDLQLAGRLNELIDAGRAGDIDEIIIALPQSADRRISELTRRLGQLPVRIAICTHIASDLVQIDLSNHRVSALGPLGLLEIKSKPISDWGPILKRLVDFVVASLALVVLSPLFLALALAIRLDTPGPALFRQKRHGLNHRIIEVLKFRTMHVMEDDAVVRQATRDDARVTRLGRFLRRTSLDELPQLVNVQRGEMSLVGPRPHALVHNERYGEMLESYANRHQVKPGITGWAQVSGFRGETQAPEDMRNRVEHDLHYIDNWSLWLDIKILVMTPFLGLTHKNAY